MSCNPVGGLQVMKSRGVVSYLLFSSTLFPPFSTAAFVERSLICLTSIRDLPSRPRFSKTTSSIRELAPHIGVEDVSSGEKLSQNVA